MRSASPSPRLIRRGVALCSFLTLVLLLVDLNRDGERCGQECFGTFRTFEAGHPWTSYPDSWQWDAQNAIAGVAFLLAGAAFLSMLFSRLRRAVVLTGLSLILGAAWIGWVALSPPIG